MEQFKDILEQKVKAVEDVLSEMLPESLPGVPDAVTEAMRYSLMAGGKRLRPVMMAESFYVFGGTNERMLRYFQSAIEMIHTYSLIHDDLPAMDNDDYRRGRLTNHKVYGEAMAILAGDGLLNTAFERAAAGCAAADTPEEMQRCIKALALLAEDAGIRGMIGGQVLDMDGPSDLDQVLSMYRKKTATLIDASLACGAILAGAPEEDLALVRQMADDVGLAFQIRDDILDETGDEKKLGKPLHSDEKNEKHTYVRYAGLEAAEAEVQRLSERAVRTAGALSAKYENRGFFLTELIESLVSREM